MLAIPNRIILQTSTATFTKQQLEKARKWRRALHQHPELSGKEFATSNRIATILQGLSPSRIVRGIGGAGLIAVYDSGEAGPSILLRAELDALPIQEINDFPYRSENEGVSHKCGHDGHMSILLLVAQYLAQNPPQKGKVTLLFQPAEETGAGAALVLDDPKFDASEFDYAFALHNLPGYPLGQIVYREGPFSASVSSLIIKLHGKTAHAAEPENGQNPAMAISEILQKANKLEQPDPEVGGFAILTPVYLILGEKAYGVAAGYGEVHLTLRAWQQKDMETISNQLLEAISEICDKHQLTCETSWTDTFKTNRNHPEAIALLEQVIEQLELNSTIRNIPFKWGEDFGAFTQTIKGAMFGLGSGEDQPALHNPDFDFPDAIAETGAQVFVALCRELCYQ